LIFLVYRYKKDENGKNVMLKYSTGLKVRFKNWDSKSYRAKHGVNLPEDDARLINDIIRKLEIDSVRIVKDKPDIKVSEFKDELDYLLDVKERPKTKHEITVVEYFKKFILKSTAHDRTIAKFNGVYNHLINYEKDLDKEITFDQINPEFSEHFTQWLYRTKKHSQNNASKVIGVLKQVVEDAYENEYHSNARFKSKKFKVSRIKTSKHYLDLTELEMFAAIDLSKQPTLERARDLWAIAAFSGLRYSDFSRLQKKHLKKVKGKLLIHMHTYKGRDSKEDNEIVIPVLPQLDSILKKYDYEPPQAYSSQKMNQYIKEAAKKAKLNRTVDITKSIAGKTKNSTGPLSDQITNHTARYTFINIMLNEIGLKPQRLQKITGQTLKVLAGYDRGDKTKNALDSYADIIEGMEKSKLRVV